MSPNARPVAAEGEADLGQLRLVLIDMLRPATVQVPALEPAAWDELTRIALQHRVAPLLHHKFHGAEAVPAEQRQRWKEAHRAGAIQALLLAADLADLVGLLEAAGFAPIALKGAWLAWHAYPHPALRPMRDLDLLLSPETVVAAFELLQERGYRSCAPAELAASDAVRLDKHMPPLVSPRGITVELHQRLWEIDGRMDHAAPAADEAGIRAGAVRQGGITFLAPHDLLVHLIVHAVYDHRLDCGPLVLPDIACLLHRHPIDWPRFWTEAEAGRWSKGARLVLAMVAAHDPTAPLEFPAGGAEVPEDFERLAATLLLQELDTRQSAGVAATLAAGGAKAFGRRLLARRSGNAPEAGTVARDLSAEGGFSRWAGSRLHRTLRELARQDTRNQSRSLARLSRWLDT